MNRQSVSRTVALGGMLTALGWLFLLLAFILPTGRLFLLALSSFVVLVAWAELSPLRAVVVYAAVSGLAFIYPGLFVAALFVFFFGLAPLISLILHKLLPRWPATLLRHLILTGLLAAAILLAGIAESLQALLRLDGAVFWLAAVGLIQVFLFVYDYFLRGFSSLWTNRLRPGTRFF